ncbi:hypothetical protein H072_7154 [Dactylellina haptotyla CBS 200.50]|uniref:Golgi apparatus membrane protein TVP38 n=1 Tax=Dactylellina haptotyla (strain CBS 200.50) TaxID=1284197 RepID=S8A882_DACHA|nr:hypothetical protein H072_7154 [Dactylellina haptotyla CBS 200.50]
MESHTGAPNPSQDFSESKPLNEPSKFVPPEQRSDDINSSAPKGVYEKTDYWKFIKEKKYWPWWGVLVVLAVLVVLMTVYHKDIVHWLQPVSARIRALSWGWIIPILILIALSFPPLFGHEIIIVLCGAVYGLWIGFGIVAAGTFIGEILTYFAFRTVLRSRAEKLERKNLDYAALARITREGGFWIVFIVRLSVIPGHFSTAVFAVCGVNFWAYALASLVTLPKQLVIVYLGVILGNDHGGRLVSDIVLGITFLVTILAGVFIWWKLRNTRRIMISEAAEGVDGSNDDAAGNKILGERTEENLEVAAAEHEISVQEGNLAPPQSSHDEQPRNREDGNRYASFV